MFCSVCGAQNPGQQKFCRSCGKPLSSAETLAADADDPLKTRLSIPTDFKPATPQPSQPQHVEVEDNMATVVGMPAVKPPAAPQQNTSAPDPFATQVGGGSLNVNQLRELAAKSAAAKNSSSHESVDNMATVVGMQAVKPLTPPPPATQSNDDMMKTVVGPMKAITPPPAPPKESADPLATVVGMPAVDANIFKSAAKVPEKAPEKAPEKTPEKAAAKAPEPPKPKEISKPALPENKTPAKTESSNNSQSNSSNSGVLIAIAVVIIILIIAIAVLYLRK